MSYTKSLNLAEFLNLDIRLIRIVISKLGYNAYKNCNLLNSKCMKVIIRTEPSCISAYTPAACFVELL